MRQKDKILICGGTLLDPLKKRCEKTDIYIEQGAIKKIGKNLKAGDALSIDAQGKYITPGFIDLHTHLREPGREDEETIATGAYAALAGGFTKICCMPNTTPAIDNEGTVKFILQESARVDYATVLPIGAATKGRKGEEIAEIGTLVQAGVVAISDDGDPITNSGVMRRVLEYSKVFDIPVISHCEVKNLSSDGVINEGVVATKLGLRGIPDIAEAAMVFEHILLANYTKSRLHIAHISTKKSVEIIQWAKEKGIEVSCETCPQYFTLNENACVGFDTNFKVNPPLRTETDVEAIKVGLATGIIDAIATDHAPHLASEKEVEFDLAPFGMIGLETAFSLGLEELVLKRYLSLEDYIAKLTIEPAKILKLKPPTIAVGEKADLVIFDSKAKWVYKKELIKSKSQNSPFIDKELTGKIFWVIKGSRIFEF
ncbi:MAG: dihydroorotase [candidate division WOR-3 bacterium]